MGKNCYVFARLTEFRNLHPQSPLLSSANSHLKTSQAMVRVYKICKNRAEFRFASAIVTRDPLVVDTACGAGPERPVSSEL